MEEGQRHLLLAAWAWCDQEDKSSEFMLTYMADIAEIEYDEALEFVRKTSEEERRKWYKENIEA